ncbi:phosphate ABC transporter permease PstA [Devosia sp.]|uniref:phosphate ABC transporter permease PstA n=1 Tax=Devosia sp. TaxID=1871048 RepID=UPI003F70B1DE
MTDQIMKTEVALGSTSIHTGEAAKGRLKRRYRNEAIFKGLGLGAILIAIGFLVLILSSVVIKGVPAFTYNFASIPFDFSSVDRTALPKADYDAVVRDSLRTEFPEVTSRGDRRLLGALLSSGSPVLLRDQVIANPTKIDEPRAFSVPISDFADLYLKGQVSPSTWSDGGAAASLATTGENVTLTTESSRFADILDSIRVRLEAEAGATRARLAGAVRSLERTQANLAATNERLAGDLNEADRTRLTADVARMTTDVANVTKQTTDLEAAAVELERRAASAKDGEALTPADPSVLIYAGHAIIKVEDLTPTSAAGELVHSFDTATPDRITDWRVRVIDIPETGRKFSDKEIVWTDALVEKGYVTNSINWLFLTRGASREAEMAGIWGAVVGSFLTLTVTLALAFPIGVGAAIYLEEFAPKNRWTTFIEVNINNLAAVPSIVFGLLGLAVFLNFFGLDRSAPYVGGLVLGLMTLPTIIIASRVALRAVPPSIREAAFGIGASRLQTVFHHVLPLAMPGVLTGAIIGMARALGETAPLLMIGMVAFVVDIPSGFTSPATVLPVQIYMWADFPEPAFEQRTSAGILVLLAFLVTMNALAVFLRRRFERRW